MKTTPLRVSLVEDHPILGNLLRDFIANLPRVESCTVAPNAEKALQDLEDGSTPDLMFIDLSLPGMNGIELIHELRSRRPDLPCAILSGHRSRAYARKAFAAGAAGYVVKGDPVEIESAILSMLAGKRYVTPNLMEEF